MESDEEQNEWITSWQRLLIKKNLKLSQGNFKDSYGKFQYFFQA